MPTVVVTGATGAIGSAAVAALQNRRASVIALSRPEFDLSSLASIRAAARELSRGGHIDALLNIAAVYSPRFQKSADGIELMLAVNHVGPFLLTNLLRNALSGGGRVLTVTAPSPTRDDVARLLDRGRFSAFQSFGGIFPFSASASQTASSTRSQIPYRCESSQILDIPGRL